jgi:hypothetical protein
VLKTESSIGTVVTHSSAVSNPKLQKEHKETWYSKLFWQIVIPIAVTVIAAIIILRLTGKKEKRPVNRLCLNGFRVLLFVMKT